MAPKSNNGPSATATETNDNEQQETSKPDDDIPACQLCRKKKAKCNRAQPCSQCIRFNVSCVYDDRNMKPGLRAGAVDQLCRRVETLENMFLGQEMIWQQMWQTLCPNAALPESLKRPSSSPDLEKRREELKSALLSVGAEQTDRKRPAEESDAHPVKRPRVDLVDSPSFLVNPSSDSTGILPAAIMNELVDFYCINIHPWIPILHMEKFRQRMQLAEERPRIACILHAIIAIGRGRGPSSWSIVGSMVGTVEHLQLNVEEDALYGVTNLGETLIRRMIFLSPSSSWSEAEERRRIFWTIFLMDRFCSISTGWKISLTNNDVKRRLPCEGALWQKGHEIQTPYFGISDSKETATNSILNGKRSTNPEDHYKPRRFDISMV
ncbi:hypothetical protein N7490_007463 [Penicillium lividum]|nr:hypothetical protein N7490_007463 [Penicillium lividum]